MAIKRIKLDADKLLPLYTPEYTGGIPIFNRRFFEKVYAAFSEQALIVFDN